MLPPPPLGHSVKHLHEKSIALHSLTDRQASEIEVFPKWMNG